MRHIAVVIPANNEEERVEACLESVLVAGAACSIDVSVTLVADSCSDRTVALARGFPTVAVLEINATNVGIGRAAGVRCALECWAAQTSAADLSSVWIANTDADSLVPEDWLVQQLVLADAGYEVVVGSVVPLADEYPMLLQQRWSRSHAGRGGRRGIYGANLGVRADAYQRVGGFAPLVEHEDVELVRGFRNGRVRYSDATPVRTSARLDGRTPGGFAGFLRAERRAVACATTI